MKDYSKNAEIHVKQALLARELKATKGCSGNRSFPGVGANKENVMKSFELFKSAGNLCQLSTEFGGEP